jgi:hypothetical protein
MTHYQTEMLRYSNQILAQIQANNEDLLCVTDTIERNRLDTDNKALFVLLEDVKTSCAFS